MAGFLFIAGIRLVGAPMVTLGKHAALHVEGDLELKSLSNITMAVDNKKARSDTIISFTPGLQFTLFEQSPHINFSLAARRSFIHFLDEDYFNEEPWNIAFQTGYNGDLFSLNAFYVTRETMQNISSEVYESPSNARLEDDIVQSTLENFGLNFHIAFSPKTGFRSGVTWTGTNYAPDKNGNDNFRDLKEMVIPFTLFYKVTPKLESSLGYRLRRNDVEKWPNGDLGPKYTDHYLHVSLLGHVTAKTDVQVVVGYQNRNLRKNDPQHSFATDVHWKFMATEKLHLRAGLFRDFSVGSKEGATIEISSANAGFDLLFNRALTLNTKGQIRHSEYSTGRKDLGVNGGATLTLKPSKSHWEFRTGYRYDWSEFKMSGDSYDYKNHNFSLGSSFLY